MERGTDEESRRRSLAPEGLVLLRIGVIFWGFAHLFRSSAIVPVLACVLNQLCARNDQLPVDQTAITKFHALKPPTISIREYLER